NKGLVAYYPFNGNANDESGNGNHSTPRGNTQFLNNGLSGGTLRINGDFSLYDSGGGWVQLPLFSTKLNAGFTFSLWVKDEQMGGYPVNQEEYISIGELNHSLVSIGLTDNGNYVIWKDLSSGSQPGVTSKAVGDDRSWKNLILTYSPGTLTLYRNGSLIWSMNTTKDIFPVQFAALGKHWWDNGGSSSARMSCTYENVRIYERALNAQEIGQLYQTESGDLDTDGDGLADAWEQGFGRYQIVSGSFTWDQAKADAEARGGHLATITSQDEWNVIWSQLGPTWNGANYWLGGSDQGSEGNWHWVTGENWSFSRWYPSEPSGGAENELITWANLSDGQPSWNDGLGNNLPGSFGGYILEYGYPTDPGKADTDGDRFDDKVESLSGTDPNSATSVPDSQAPLITLMGANPLEIYKGTTFTDPGATVTDNRDSTRTIAGSGAVNTATVGIYTLTYTATDAAGNLALPVTRTVNVVLDPAGDEDGDGLSNSQEMTLGTSPYQKDSDGDGVNDPVEVADGTNPSDANSYNNLNKGLVAYYPFNGNANDESGNGHQGTLVNSTVSESGLAEAGNSLRISGGMDSWMAVADSSLFRPRGFTISMWIYNNLSDDSGVRYVCGKNYEQMEIHLSNSVNSKSGIRFIPTNGCYVDTLTGTPASQWFHLVCIAGEGSEGGKIYIDGVEVPVSRLGSVDGAQPINLGSDPFYLGRRTENGWQHLDGRMDNVRVYGRTLSASEIGQLYQTESGNLDSDGDGLTDASERGFGRYQIVSGNFTWDQAKADAEARGGHLATITSEGEWSLINSILGSEINGKNLWLGGTDSETEGMWKWITGESWTYSRWKPSEPNNSFAGNPESFVQIYGSEDDQLRWNDLPNSVLGITSNWPWGNPSYLLEFGYPTDPKESDTDGDGFDDKTESLARTDPNNPNDPTPGLSTGLIAFYRFDGNADDSLGNQPPLTLFGSRSFIPDGLSGGALRTDGDRWIWYSGGGYFSPAFLENSNLTAATFVFWTRNDASGGPLSPAHTEEAWLEVGYGDTPSISIGARALDSSGTFGSVTVNWVDWKMHALTILNTSTGSDWVAYMNGVEYARGSTTGKLFPSPNIKFGSHTWNGGGDRSARMTVEWDNLRIYNKSLSAADIKALYRQDSPNSDNEAPVITLIGSNSLQLYKGSAFTDPGATVTDNVDALRTITGSGTIDISIVGIYTLTYTATDAAGNLGLPVTRTVNVVLDPALDEDGDGMTNAQELALGTDPYQKDLQILFTIEGKVQSGTGLTAGQDISISLKAHTTYLPNDYFIQTEGSYLYWESAQKGLFSSIGGSEIGLRDISVGGYSAIGFVEWDPRNPTSLFQ
ncbi:MAG: DUF5011 domain-containing protein, partial [Actinobacteria bacterium]|nr:DUF5011 domain-containing protein [Actinomycetota bacterium]